MRITEFDYELPEEAIAQRPIEPRDASRLLVIRRDTGTFEHRVFREILEYLRPGDTLVVNETRVIPARLHAHKESGGRVEVLLIRRRAPGEWEVLVKPARRVQPGAKLIFSGQGLQGEVTARTPSGGRILQVAGAPDPDAALLAGGEMPLPPYIHETLEDAERYQTVYARQAGSAAAPTAGLHFTPGLMEQVRSLGVQIAKVTLHVGLATFQPVRVEEIEEHEMHLEEYSVSPEAAQAINETPGRVIAVGTTTTRVLESVAGDDGRVHAGSGETRLFIRPGYRFRVVDAMVTNFHVPRSTLLLMISAFAGRDLVFRAYREALEKGYRFLSFGDAMLIL